MWIFLNDAFLSIVSDRNDQARLLVRARFKGDIERAFPGVRSSHTPHADYPYRAGIDRKTVAKVLSEKAAGIRYPNFKDSVTEPWREGEYLSVWSTMREAQERRASQTEEVG